MDLYCMTCAEAWDNDSLHEEAEASGRTYREVAADFRKNGCKALSAAFGPQICEPTDPETSETIGIVYELLGDDMDGDAVELDDLF